MNDRREFKALPGGGGDTSAKECGDIYVRTPDMIHTSTGTDIHTIRNWPFHLLCCCDRFPLGYMEIPVAGGAASWEGGSGTVTYIDARNRWVYTVPPELIVVKNTAGTVVPYVPANTLSGTPANRSGELVVDLTLADGWLTELFLTAVI